MWFSVKTLWRPPEVDFLNWNEITYLYAATIVEE